MEFILNLASHWARITFWTHNGNGLPSTIRPILFIWLIDAIVLIAFLGEAISAVVLAVAFIFLFRKDLFFLRMNGVLAIVTLGADLIRGVATILLPNPSAILIWKVVFILGVISTIRMLILLARGTHGQS